MSEKGKIPMTIEEFETEIKEILKNSKDKDKSKHFDDFDEYFEIKCESSYKAKFLQITAWNILAYGTGKTWQETFLDAIESIEIASRELVEMQDGVEYEISQEDAEAIGASHNFNEYEE